MDFITFDLKRNRSNYLAVSAALDRRIVSGPKAFIPEPADACSETLICFCNLSGAEVRRQETP